MKKKFEAEVIKHIQENAAKIKEEFLKAFIADEYLKGNEINIEDLELVEQRNGLSVVYFIRRKFKTKLDLKVSFDL